MEDKEGHKLNADSQEAGQEVIGEERYEPNRGLGSVHLLHLNMRGRERERCMCEPQWRSEDSLSSQTLREAGSLIFSQLL